MTACVIFSPRRISASALSLARIIAEISGGVKVLGLAVHFHFHRGVAVGGLDDLVRHAFDFLLHLVEFAAHEALDGIDGVARVGDGLALGGVADQPLAALGERDNGWRGAFAFGIFQHERFAAFHDRHAGVRGAQINA